MTNAARAILVVDDELEACHNLADIFSDLGYRVEIATSAESALALAQHAPFDIALLDLMLPTADGIALFESLKTLQPNIKGYVLTAYPQHTRVVSAQAAGVTNVLAKPIDIGKLLVILAGPNPPSHESSSCAS